MVAASTMLNTLNFSCRLKGHGFTAEQAEALADALSEEAMSGVAMKADLTEFVTKKDLNDLELTLTIRVGAIGAAMVTIILAGMRAITH